MAHRIRAIVAQLLGREAEKYRHIFSDCIRGGWAFILAHEGLDVPDFQPLEFNTYPPLCAANL